MRLSKRKRDSISRKKMVELKSALFIEQKIDRPLQKRIEKVKLY